MTPEPNFRPRGPLPSGPPERQAPRSPDLYSPRGVAPVHLVATANAVSGYFTHYTEGRTVPCGGEPARCQWCTCGLGRRWKCYLPAYLPMLKLSVLFELTLGAYTGCPGLAKHAGKLRGKCFSVHRTKHERNAPVVCTMREKEWSEYLPPPFDPSFTLARVWGVAVPSVDDAEAVEL